MRLRALRKCRLRLALMALIMSASAILSVPVTAATAAPQGEIWEWALGRDAFNDPDIRQYTGALGATIGGPCNYTACPYPDFTVGEAVVANQGFVLVPTGPEQVIGAVELHRKDSVFQAYSGRLPFGLQWGMSGADVDAAYDGAFTFESYSGGLMPLTFEGMSSDGRYRVELAFDAFFPANFPTAQLDKIIVSRGPNYQVQ